MIRFDYVSRWILLVVVARAQRERLDQRALERQRALDNVKKWI